MRLAVIPARGGSKRIPRKNIKSFCGKPIIAYSIETALESKLFDHVVVSTDDDEISEIAQQYGATVPFKRPTELADDFIGTNPIVKHAIEWFADNNTDITEACCIYATAPLLTTEYLQQGFKQLQTGNRSFAFSVTSFAFPIQRALRLLSDDTVEAINPEMISKRSQDLEEAWHDAGQFYWGTAEAFLKELPVMSKHSTATKLPRYQVQDIDTEEDWKQAELMYQALTQR